MTTQQVANRHNLHLANSYIHDDEPTIALYTDPNESIFHTKLSDL